MAASKLPTALLFVVLGNHLHCPWYFSNLGRRPVAMSPRTARRVDGFDRVHISLAGNRDFMGLLSVSIAAVPGPVPVCDVVDLYAAWLSGAFVDISAPPVGLVVPSIAIDLDDCLRKSLRCSLRHVLADAVEDAVRKLVSTACNYMVVPSPVNWRRDLKPARTSSEKTCGCSQAAKWPPRSSLL